MTAARRLPHGHGGANRAVGIRRPRGVERVVPFALLAVSTLVAMVALPSSLRPPPSAQTEQAELSPDAPPDEQADSIIAALNRGTSASAGDGLGASGGEPGVSERDDALGEGAPRKRPSSCPFGFGNPPRQTFSLYSPPCAPAFVGDNGGATWRGVTATEVVVAVAPNGGPRPSKTGWIATEPQAGETASDRTWRVYQAYFNQQFQLYGRQLRLYGIRAEATATQRSAAAVAADDVGAFAVLGRGPELFNEAVRRGMVTWGANGTDRRYMVDNAPYMWSWAAEGDLLLEMAADMWCKQLAGGVAEWSRDPVVGGRPRRLGVITYDSPIHRDFEGVIRRELRGRCGDEPANVIRYNLNDNIQGLAGAMTRMRSAGVTTVACMCDELTPAALTNDATNQGYFPEWFMIGPSMMDLNANARLYNPGQWSQAFGLSTLEMARAAGERDAYVAYRSVDPEGEPHEETAEQYFQQLQQLVVGIQSAGPRLTASTYMSGLQQVPRRAPDPEWAVAGGFGPGDFTYADWASLVWWDPSAVDPDGQPGAYRHLFGGRRFPRDGFEPGRQPFFEDGVTTPSG